MPVEKWKSKKPIISWCFYDWASSAYPTLVLTFVFATYFTKSIAVSPIRGTEQWGNAVALAGILIALLSPLSGAIADHQGRRKPWLAFCTLLMVISSGALWWALPQESSIPLVLSALVMGMIGLEVGMVFYNAMLQSLAPKNYIGRVSGWGWGFGYVGGLTCLALTLVLFINPSLSPFHFDQSTAEQVRICGPFIALWTALFALPIFLWTPESGEVNAPVSFALIKNAFKTLVKTLRTLPSYRAIFIFLIAHMLYIDGLNTLFAFGGIYAAGTFGLSMTQVLVFGIAMNVTAGLGAIGLAWMDDFVGPKPTILLSIVAMTLLGAGALIVKPQWAFWVLALLLGLFVGPVQAASRSLMARLAPKHIVTELFGFYAFSGKATAFMNPWLVGVLTITFHSQRIGLASTIVFLVMGGVLLCAVRTE